MFSNIILSISLAHSASVTIQERLTQEQSGPDVFFSLRTTELVLYSGMEQYGCRSRACSQVSEIDTLSLVAKLKNGSNLSIGGPADTVPDTRSRRARGDSDRSPVKWSRIPSVLPRSVPQVPDYTFARAYQVVATDSYVGLWHRSGPGSDRKTIVVLFDGGNVEGSGVPAACGPYRILASLDARVDILEVRPIHHVGEAVNLASYDAQSKALWLARMILPEGGLGCNSRR